MSDKSPSKKQKSLSNSTKGVNKNNKLFITFLDPTIPKEELEIKLRSLIQKISPISKIDIKKNYNNKYSFAFVDFSDNSSASKVLQACRDKEINGKKLVIDYQRKNPREFKPYPKQNFSSTHQNYPKNVNRNQYQREQPRKREKGYDDRKREEVKQKKKDERVEVKKHRRSYSRQEKKNTDKMKYKREQSPKRPSKKYENRGSSELGKERGRNGNTSKKYEGGKYYSGKRYESGYKIEKRNQSRRDNDSISQKSERRSRYAGDKKYGSKNQQIKLKERRRQKRRNDSYSSSSPSFSSSSYEQKRKGEGKNNRNRREYSSSSKEHNRRYRNSGRGR